VKKQTQFWNTKVNVTVVDTRNYEDILQFQGRKNKANSFRIEYCVMRIAKRNLKKQSQFSNIQMSVTSVMTKAYDNRPAFGVRENKPNLFRIECCVMRAARRNLKNQSQSPAFGRKLEILNKSALLCGLCG
jgi:hypothetical protein